MIPFLHVLSQNKIIFTGLCDNLATNVEELKKKKKELENTLRNKDGHYTYILIFQNWRIALLLVLYFLENLMHA